MINAQGTSVYSTVRQPMPGATASIDFRDIPGLPLPFAGSVQAMSTGSLVGQVDTYAKPAQFSLEKNSTTATVTDAGQVVPYSYVIRNTGSGTLTGITLSDDHIDGGTTVCTVAALGAEESTTCEAQHTVTQAEMDAGGSLTNTATADAAQTALVQAVLSIPIVKPTAPCKTWGSPDPRMSLRLTSMSTCWLPFAPAASARPITYVWTADEQTTRVNVVNSTQDMESFTWAKPGIKEVKVAAGNTGGTANAGHVVRIANSKVVGVGAPTILEQMDRATGRCA